MRVFTRLIVVASLSALGAGSAHSASNKPAPARPAPQAHPIVAHPANGRVRNPGRVVARPAPAARAFAGHAFHGRVAWEQGHWHHEMRNGRIGWWWDVDGAAYLYDAPVYPYPADVSDVEALEEPDQAAAAEPQAPLPPPTAGTVVGGVVGNFVDNVLGGMSLDVGPGN